MAKPQKQRSRPGPGRAETAPGGRAKIAAQARRKRNRRGRRTLHYIILLTFLIAAGVIMSLTVLFKIEDIHVIGTDRYRPEDIEEASGILRGENLLRIKTGQVEENILSRFPYVESIRVVRRFPPKVELVITQCIPKWAVAYEGEIGLVAENGKLLERGDLLVPPDMIIVKGIDLSGYSPGDYLGGEEDSENEERFIMLQYLANAAEKTGFTPITNIDISDRLNMRMVYEARLVLELGSESDMEYKLTFLQDVIGKLSPEDQARLDASNIKDKRVLVKWGRVEGGVFYPLTEEPPVAITKDPPGDEENADDGRAQND